MLCSCGLFSEFLAGVLTDQSGHDVTMRDGLEGEDLIFALKQIFRSFRPHIRKHGSAEKAEESIRRMEELDENFHK